MTFGPLAESVRAFLPVIEGQRVQVWGTLHDETFMPKGARNPVTYQVVHAERIQTPDGTLPPTEASTGDGVPVEAPSLPAFDMDAVDAESKP